MRKFTWIILLFVLFLTGCGKANTAIVEIPEKMFMTQVADVYANQSNYIGKTLKLEGIYGENTIEDITYKSVYRKNPGCCGSDGTSGFEIEWNDKNLKIGEWIEVVGVLEQYTENNEKYLRIKATDLNVLSKRGLEFVTQ